MDQNYRPESLFKPATLVQMLRDQAARIPHQPAVIYLRDGEQQEKILTYAELDKGARAVAAWLQQENVESGKRAAALLLYPPGPDFIITFFGCLYAGIIAVPVYPPRLNRPSKRIQAVVADSEAAVALTTTKIYEGLERRFSQMPDLADLRWLNTERMPHDLENKWHEPQITADSLAFLQYTSGSTGSPKGVMLSHGNLMHNLELIRRGFRLAPGEGGAFWLPNYHDMGLIGGILEPFYIGGKAVLMAPAAFLQRPVRWLKAISQYKMAISGAPNFAYQLCVDKISPEQLEGLDLNHWRLAFCGAEPVRQETLDKFAAAFAPQGFKPDAFYPCYGLAEGTLIVSGGDGPAKPAATYFNAQELAQNRAVPVAAGAEGAVSMVSCGRALLDQKICIADPQTLNSLEEGQVGEIWVKGSSVAKGYWRQPFATEQTFHAYLADSGEGPFLRTGDLGFMLKEELYVTGRLKDLIIIRGRNYYPQDIEHTVGGCHQVLEEGMGAAFSITEEGEEKLVIVNEVARRHRKPNINSVVVAIRRAVAREHQLQVHAVVLIKPLSVPRTSSGKIIRHACKRDFLNGSLMVVGQWQASQETDFSGEVPTSHFKPDEPGEPDQGVPIVAGHDTAAVANWLVAQLAQRLRLNPQGIDLHTPFVDYGLDSVQAVSMAGDLENWLGRSLSPTLIWDFPTIDDLSRHLAGQEEAEAPTRFSPESVHEPIAVIGMSCRFPGADDPDAFWQLLQSGVDAVVKVPAERWDLGAFYKAGPEPQPGKMSSQWGGFVDQVDQFDASFFAISPREATRMDPQQRLLLEVTWEALERGGQNPTELAAGATGVFIGISSSDYSRRQYSSPELIDAYAGTGNAHSVAANRLSYTLDLRGPSMAIDTACSSSLVAAHMAMNSLRLGESDVALAGGVNLLLEPDLTITFSQARMMAADGRCKTFDARADGYVRGEGCGILVLKRLADAERDGDPIIALLHGSAVNQDGRSNGLTAPHGPAQQAVIRRALADAKVEAAAISYIEAHGTGTSLGDPIEVHSLQMVMDEPQEAQPLTIGSVKTNIGHLEAAAGVAGLIKTILALEHELIPPHLHYQELNPHINLEGSRLRIGAEATPWPRTDQARLAGVSSFGFGGTNAHIIVGEGPRRAAPAEELQPGLFTISAKDGQALKELAGRYTTFLEKNPTLSLADICYTANRGRAAFAHRLALTVSSTEELRQRLSSMDDAEKGSANGPVPQVAFLFTGQGAQYENMGRSIYETEPVFRAALEQCAAILAGELDKPLLDVIYPQATVDQDGIESLLNQTQYTQPALFAVEYALAALWRSWGIEPDVVIGHSVGEYVAACIAGVMSLEDGLKLIAARGRLMGGLPSGGAMAALFTSEQRAKTAVEPYSRELSIAAVNGPDSVVISGTEKAVTAVVAQLTAEGVEARPLTVSHAFHSPLMDPILEPFRQVAARITFNPPRIPLVSNVSGRLLPEAPDAAYWVQHLRQPVRFSDGIQAVAAFGAAAFLEIGPQPHLTGMGQRVLKATKPQLAAASMWLPSLLRKKSERQILLESLGKLFVAGLDIAWPNFYAGTARQKIVLPTYPFQRERFWFDLDEGTGRPGSASQAANMGSSGLASKAPRRLHTAVPLFESWLEIDETTDKMALLQANSMAVASLFWGGGAHQIADLALTARLLTQEKGLLSQTTLQVTAGDAAFFQTFGAAEGQDSWQLLAGGQLMRGPAGGSPERAVEEAGVEGCSRTLVCRGC